MAWLWASERTSGVRHHTASLGLLHSVQHVTNTGFFKADSDAFGLEPLIGNIIHFKALQVPQVNVLSGTLYTTVVKTATFFPKI